MHTNYSDGTDSPETLVRNAKFRGMDVIAITDHDITSGYLDALEEAEKWNLKIIPGVEVTCGKYHILGLDFNIWDTEFQRLLARSRRIQKSNCQKRIDILSGKGIPISMEKLEDYFPKSRLGKYNLVSTLFSDPECIEYIERVNGKRMTSREIFEHYLGKKGIAGKISYQKNISEKQAIETIHAAGGIAIVAHPFKEASQVKELDELLKIGLDGLEIQPNYREKNNPFRDYAVKNNLLVTYGSDYHGVAFSRPILTRGENVMNGTLEKIMRRKNA